MWHSVDHKKSTCLLVPSLKWQDTALTYWTSSGSVCIRPLKLFTVLGRSPCDYTCMESILYYSILCIVYSILYTILYIYIYMEKAMAPHSSTLAWKIPQTEEPGRLQSMGSLGVGHDWATSLSLFTFIHWRRKWQPTLVFLPGESQGRGSLVGCSLWGRTESDTTEATWQQ